MKNCIDPAGRYIIYILDVYDDPNFFKIVTEHIEGFQKDEIVILY